MAELGFLTVAPALLAIAAAFVLRKVALSLLIGLLFGTVVLSWDAPLHIPARLLFYLWGALRDGSHLWILSFALLLGGLMGLLRSTGGRQQIGMRVSRLARDRRGGQLAAWGLGLLFFFDDYANTMFVGQSMGPATRRLRISKEKLAFIVDATAAPVASIAPISSWIAVELGYIADQLSALQLPDDAYALFLETILLRFYPLLMLAFGLLVALMGLDFGPMLQAERAVAAVTQPFGREEEVPEPPPSKSPLHVALPMVLGFLALFGALYWTGRGGAIADGRSVELGTVLQFASSSKALVVATLVTLVSTLTLAAFGPRGTWRRAVSAVGPAMLGMMEVVAVLLLAWSLGDLCRDLKTAKYLVGLLGDDMIPGLLPTAVFIVSGAVSFATGTSWGTMGILFPLSVPLAHELAPGDHSLLVATVASVLSGSVFGDHCSPISDTTIMSALATECDQLAHVKTQLPYALLVGGVSIACGTLPVGLGLLSAAPALLLATGVLGLGLRVLGQRPRPLAQEVPERVT